MTSSTFDLGLRSYERTFRTSCAYEHVIYLETCYHCMDLQTMIFGPSSFEEHISSLMIYSCRKTCVDIDLEWVDVCLRELLLWTE